MRKYVKLIFAIAFVTTALGCVGQNPAPYENSSSFRSAYGLDANVFSNLPDYPEDFSMIDNEVSTLRADHNGLKFIKEEYYRQPEFYPTWESLGVGLMKNPPQDRIAIWGYGSYPSERREITTAGSNFTKAAFFHTSWMVVTYQGIKAVPEYDDRYFDVTVVPRNFILKSAYPKFNSEWARRVFFNVHVKDETPKGTYVINVATTVPDSQYQEAWRSAFGNRYVNAPEAQPDRPLLKIEVIVT